VAAVDRRVAGAAFAPVPERAAYVPRPTTEAALRALASALEGGTRRVAVRGPAGMGKSLLLRLLEGRLPASFDVLHAAPGVLPLADLLAYALGSRAARGGALPAGPGERILVLPIDDAEELTIPVARGLGGLVRKAEGALRLVLAVRGEPSEALVAALGGSLAEVALDQPMSEPEVALYLAVRLHRAGASEDVRRRLGAEHAARLHALSGGNPGRLNRLASELLAGHALAEPTGSEAPPPAVRAPGAPLPRDPFGPAANPAAYQPRTSCEAILGRIEREILAGRQAIVVSGPTGIGKTTLLRVLETRLREPYQVVAIPYARLEPREFFDFALHQIGAPPSPDPEHELLALAERMADVGGMLVLAIDDADFLTPDTASCLTRALATARGRLRIVGTVDDESSAEPPALPGPTSIRMVEPLAPAEAEAYVVGRLLHFEAPAVVRRRFDRHTIETLHSASKGLPGELNRLAGAIEREALGAALAAVPREPHAPAAPAAAPAPPPPAPRTPASVRREPSFLETALALLPHVGLGLGIPLALLALWLWLAPLFGSGSR
jgi:type II secretory pathway predicted ATPase ExeA